WNRAMEQITGIPKDAILGKGNYEYAKPLYGSARPILIDYVMERDNRILSYYENTAERNGVVSGEAYLSQLHGGKGGNVLITACTLVDERDQIAGAIESIRDITEQKKHEETLRASEENYRTIFNSAVEAFFIHHPEKGAILAFNQKAREMCEIQNPGQAPDHLSLFWKYESAQEIEQIMRRIRAASQGIDQTYEKIITNHAGRSFWVEVTLKKIVLGGQNRVLAILHDIHSRKIAEQEKLQLEEQLQQSQKMEAVGKLAGGVAHDFNNLLTVIQGYSEMALDCTQPGESIHYHIEEIKKAVSRAESITRQLLTFSRRQIIQPQVLDVNSIIQNLGKILNRIIGENIEMQTLLDPNLNSIKIDPNQLEQTIINLAINARDAMPQGGKITLETRNVTIQDQYAQQHLGVSPGEYVLLRVCDTGCGMDKETQKRIFEPFFTTKKVGEGTGLGLPMVYGIAKQNQGSITVDSEVGKGSVFTIYFPAFSDETKSSNAQKRIHTPPSGTETILVVEDETSVLYLVEQILSELGYSVLCAETTEKAHQLFDAHQEEIKLLFTDVIMPQLSGRQLAEQLMEKNPLLKVLFMSGYTDDNIMHHDVRKKGIAFVQKPFRAMEVAVKIREVLDSSREVLDSNPN
ncbi:MAG: ATP-binding protein, partial [Candidatus Hinthialibacter sp.]